MATPWNEVESDADYKSLPDPYKQKVKDRYFSNVVSADEDFKKLSPDEQGKVKSRFYGVSPQSQPPAPPDSAPQPPTSAMGDVKNAVGTLLSPTKTAKAVVKGVGDIEQTAPVQAVEKTMEKRPELQPLTNKPSLPTGTPVEQGVKMAGETLAFPIRTGVTLQNAQQYAQQKTTKALLDKGWHPYTATAMGILAAVASDPLTVSAGVTGAMSAIEGLGEARQALKMSIAQDELEQAKTIATRMEGMPKPEISAKPSIEDPHIPTKPFDGNPSAETSHLPPPETASYTPKDKPASLNASIDRATNELHDLSLSKDMAVPTNDVHKDFRNILRRFFGTQELGRWDAHKMVSEFAERLPDQDRRSLVFMTAQLGRTPTPEELTGLRDTYAAIGGKEAKAHVQALDNLLKQDLTLSGPEKDYLNMQNSYYEQIGQGAQKMDVVSRLRNIYGGPSLYMSKAEAQSGAIRRAVSGRTARAMSREFDNIFEAAKEGYVAKTLDSAELVGVYHHQIMKAGAEKYLLGALEKNGLINYAGTGKPILGFNAGTVNRIIEGQGGEAVSTGEVLTRVPYATNPEVQKALKTITEEPVLDHGFIKAIEKVNALQKAANLYLQVFHPQALAAEAFGKGFSPTKFTAGLDMIEKNPEMVRSYVRAGLEINDIKDIGTSLAKNTVSSYKGANPLTYARKINDVYTDWVFRKYMVGLKVYNTNIMVERLTQMGLTPERSVQLAVEDSNRVFGGLNTKMMDRSPNMQRLFGLISFAPDWTESKLRQMGTALNITDKSLGGAGKYFGMGDVDPNEAAIIGKETRKYWARLTALATVTYMADQLNPWNKTISVDMSQESGFKDVKKLLMLLGGNPVYFTSKTSALAKDLATLMDPHLKTDAKVKKVMKQTLPINVQKVLGHL